MFSPEFRSKALKVLDECDGSCIKASRQLGVVCRTLRRWRDEAKKRHRRRYSHLSRTQKKSIAKLVGQGESAVNLADRFGVSITTIYNIRNETRSKGELSFMDKKEAINVPKVNIDDLPDDMEELKRRCAELEIDNAILAQTIEILKKTQASTHRS